LTTCYADYLIIWMFCSIVAEFVVFLSDVSWFRLVLHEVYLSCIWEDSSVVDCHQVCIKFGQYQHGLITHLNNCYICTSLFIWFFLWLFVTMHRLKNVKNCILLCVVFIHNLALFSFQIVTLTPYSGKTIKISNFWKFKMAAAAIWKITKIAISPHRFDRSLRNLVRWCKMGFLTAPAVKKIEFHKSKMADGRHFKNRYSILFQQPFDWFLLNLARWCMLIPRAWFEFQIFNFRQSYTVDRRYLANRKTV